MSEEQRKNFEKAIDNNIKRNTGIIEKYIIKRADGTPISTRARYFVLRYDQFQNDPIHMKACHEGLLAYAEAIKDHLPVLSKDLKKEIQEIKRASV